MTLLVVADDDADLRSIAGRILRRAGYTVVEAEDGHAALAAVREHRPAAVVSDIDMPVMSGVDLCEQLRADAATSDLPVIFVSGSLAPGDHGPADAQVTAILRKPYEPRQLLDCVQKALEGGHRPGQDPSVCG